MALTAAVAEPGANVAPEKAPAKKGATQKKSAPKGQKKAKGGKAKAAAPKKEAKASKKAPKPTQAKATAPRAESRDAKILEMIGGAKRHRPCRDHEGDRLVAPQRQGLHLHRRQKAQHQDRFLEERDGRPGLPRAK